MGDIDKYYEILGIARGASLEEVSQAHRDLMQIWHPDRFSHNPRLQTKAEDKAKEINAAFDKIKAFLKNSPEHRKSSYSDRHRPYETPNRPSEESARKKYNPYDNANAGSANTGSSNARQTSKEYTGTEFKEKNNEELFNVVFKGEILRGFNEQEVKRKLCQIFKIDVHGLKGKMMFANHPVVIMVNAGLPEAKQCKLVMNLIGAQCTFEEVSKEKNREKIRAYSSGTTRQPPGVKRGGKLKVGDYVGILIVFIFLMAIEILYEHHHNAPNPEKGATMPGKTGRIHPNHAAPPKTRDNAESAPKELPFVDNTRSDNIRRDNPPKGTPYYPAYPNPFGDTGDSDNVKPQSENPQTYMFYLQRGEANMRNGNFRQAIGEFSRAIEIEPNNSAGYTGRGVSYEMVGDFRQAIGDFTNAIKLKPDSDLAFNGRGYSYLRTGDYPQAINDFSRAIELKPDGSISYAGRGVSYQSMGNHQQAIGDFSRAIAIDPRNGDTFANRALSFLNTGNYQLAVNDYRTAARLGNKTAQSRLSSQGIGW
ncbi:MAG: tetratricopeptide repeat protein [Nitrospirae bacterium]|nr:tetratricopeptide repeat protein [Nitrospirota bacterium]